jgi:hypothetical protein
VLRGGKIVQVSLLIFLFTKLLALQLLFQHLLLLLLLALLLKMLLLFLPPQLCRQWRWWVCKWLERLIEERNVSALNRIVKVRSFGGALLTHRRLPFILKQA